MYITYLCPQCDQQNRSDDLTDTDVLSCDQCDWERPFAADRINGNAVPNQCLRCGNPDLWRQKNFSQKLGLGFVAAGAVTSSIAWMYYRPILALSILMGFALIDMVLYIVMPDVLVCYRCRTKHHNVDVTQHQPFDHELGEKYRQEKIRREQAKS